MVLEATVICLDNSEWMRNGDYIPSRFEAQQDAVNLICAAKTQSNPESCVSVMTMAQSKNGIRAEVLVTLSQDLGKILSSVQLLKIGGEVDFSAAMQVAQLVLKHRQNKNQHQRIIAFVGSPVKETSEELVKLAKKLKKNNIAIDLINFGEEALNVAKLETFVTAVNNNNESHLMNITPGPLILSEILLSSPIVVGEGAGGFGAAAAASAAAAAAHAATGAAPGEFDFDPNMDPELAMALRISMEEERARQEAEANRRAAEQTQSESGATATASGQTAAPPPLVQDVEMTSAETDDELMAALQMSLGAAAQAQGEGMELSEDEQFQLAMQMSMSMGAAAQAQGSASGEQSDVSAALQDPDFLNSVLTSLPGVDPNDERIRTVVSELKGDKDKEKEKDKDEKKDPKQ